MTEDSQNIQMKKEMPVSFLLDEVRCGFVIPAAIKQAWAAELTVLQEIDRVCRKHHITYYADWGTLLGCVRHGGFVPWDDDIDIVMKREDYRRFMEVARFDMEEGFDVQTFRNQPDFWLFMGKVVGKNHFCFEKEHLRKFHNFPYIACVDIFVLDYVYRDRDKEEKRKTICKYMLGIADGITEGKIQDKDREWHLRRLEQMTGQHYERIEDPVEMARYLYGETEKCFAWVPEQETDYLVQMFPWGLKEQPHYYPKEYYGEPVYLPFEYTEIPVPSLYDKMLRERYGDYLRLVKNAGAHDYPFFEGQKKNLQKVLDFPLPSFKFDREKLERIGEELEYKEKSYKTMGEECLQELLTLKDQIINTYQMQESDVTVEAISVSQQLAIDFGTMLEQAGFEKHKIIGLLERYCEELYRLYQQCSAGGCAERGTHDLSDIMQKIKQEWRENASSKEIALFLISYPGEWDNIRSLWEEKCRDMNTMPYLVILPWYNKDYDGSPMKWHTWSAGDFAEAAGLSDVEKKQILDVKQLTAEYLELLRPEQIYSQNPYDEWNPNISVPSLFYAVNLRKYTEELIYVSPYGKGELYGKDSREYENMQYYVTMPGVMYADRILLNSEDKKQWYIEKLAEAAGADTRAIWEQKILVRKPKAADKQIHKKRLLYGIGLGTYLEDPEAERRKIRNNLHIFEEHKDQIEVTIHLFPEKTGTAWTVIKNEIRELIQETLGMPGRMNINWLPGEEQVLQYDLYDAYYGDPMPAVMKFYEEKKPVMIQNMQCQEKI